jgi:hypothetical protein
MAIFQTAGPEYTHSTDHISACSLSQSSRVWHLLVFSQYLSLHLTVFQTRSRTVEALKVSSRWICVPCYNRRCYRCEISIPETMYLNNANIYPDIGRILLGIKPNKSICHPCMLCPILCKPQMQSSGANLTLLSILSSPRHFHTCGKGLPASQMN